MINKTVSHYRILEKLGEGGMGIVYKAEDTKLDRIVALKFLPPHLNASEQDKARFIQEAKAASALNHPNVCTIHDIQDHDGQMFIVMEFVDGQTLREKTRSQNLSLKSAIDIGVQIADGLAAAHEKGIVHRDIKPENIMVRRDGIVQIMDFGLAKLRGVSRLTKEGSTVGTAGYMSPEQVQGVEADHRSDIFSLGVLLYQLFTGQLPFKGVHETALAYEIVNVDAAPPSAVKPEIDPELDRIVIECLDKDPNERTQSVKQVAIDLKRARRESGKQRASRITTARPSLRPGIDASPDKIQVAGRRSYPWIPIAGIALLAGILGYALSYFISPQNEKIPVIRASIEMPPGATYSDGLGGHSAISPDGSMLAFVATDSQSQNRLWVRELNSSGVKELAGTENATYPFWSPDNKSIGFFSEGKVKIIDASGGPVLSLADAPFGRGGAWSKGGEILFSPSVSDPNLYAVSTSGGVIRKVTSFDSTGKVAPRFPFFLPDGKHFVFSMLDLGPANTSDAFAGSLVNSETTPILKGVSYPIFASGYLFFLRQGILMCQPFDPGSLVLSGNPLHLQGNINAWAPRAKADFSLSGNGVIAYSAGMSARESEFIWMGADGSESPIFHAGSFTIPVLSPDATRIAYDGMDDQAGGSIVWVYDIISKARLRLTFAEQSTSRPVWSRDGLRIYYSMEVGGSKANISFKRSDGSGSEEMLVGEAGATVGYYPLDVSPDGKYLLIEESNESIKELAVIDLKEAQKPPSLRKIGIIGSRGRFSPDGQWIVYQSNESGTERVYVSSFGGRAGKWQLSPEGGNTPLWHRNKIVYYSPALNRHESVDVTISSGTPVFGQPKPLFRSGKSLFIHGVAKDGKKYLALRPANAGSSGSLSLIVNWKGLVNSK